MRRLCETNRLARRVGFAFGVCSGIGSLEGVLGNYRTGKAYMLVDDANDGKLFRGRGGGWYKQRTVTVFLLHTYRRDDMSDRSEKLSLCRELFRQLSTRLLVDAGNLNNEMVYLHADNILCRELGRYFMNGCTGLYFMVDVSEPVDLRYDKDEWL